MAKRLSGDVAELLDRATNPQQDRDEERDQRYIYGGETRPANSGFAIRQNRHGVRRRMSTFTIILLLFASGVAIVLYVSNILAVNHLAMEVNDLRNRLDKIHNTNAVLRAEINRKSSWERIGVVATGQLGLAYPKEQPTWFEIDEDKVNSVSTK